MKALVLNYFDKTAIINSTEDAVNFINSLQYRSNSHRLSCSDYARKHFEDYFNFGTRISSQITTTGCSTTRINVYLALADTLEAHNAILKQQKEKEAAEYALKKEKAYQEAMAESHAINKGWYIVTLDILVSKIKGNDGIKTYSFKVLAESKADAFRKTENLINENGLNDKNVSFIYEIKDNALSALIEFVGVWTDNAELEYGTTK